MRYKVLYTRHIENKERIFPFAVSASGSFKTQVKPASKNRFQVFVSIRSNWNYEMLVFKGSYGETGERTRKQQTQPTYY